MPETEASDDPTARAALRQWFPDEGSYHVGDAVQARHHADDDRHPFSLDTLHDSLNRGGVEVVTVALHRQGVHTYNLRIPRDDLISYKILTDRVGIAHTAVTEIKRGLVSATPAHPN